MEEQLFLCYSVAHGSVQSLHSTREKAITSAKNWARDNAKNYPQGMLVYEAIALARTEMMPVELYDPKSDRKLAETAKK